MKCPIFLKYQSILWPKKVTRAEFRVAFHALAHAMMTQENKEVIAYVNPIVDTTTIKVSDFTRMNSPKFHGSKVEDPQEFIDEIYNIVENMGVSMAEKTK